MDSCLSQGPRRKVKYHVNTTKNDTCPIFAISSVWNLYVNVITIMGQWSLYFTAKEKKFCFFYFFPGAWVTINVIENLRGSWSYLKRYSSAQLPKKQKCQKETRNQPNYPQSNKCQHSITKL